MRPFLKSSQPTKQKKSLYIKHTCNPRRTRQGDCQLKANLDYTVRPYLKVKKCKYAFLSIFEFVPMFSYIHICTHVSFFICRVDYQAWIESHVSRIIKVSASLVQHKKDMSVSRVFSAGVPQTLPLGFWLTCIVELRLGPTTVDDHRLMLLLCHGHAQRGHGAFMNKSLETGHTQKPVIYTSPFPPTAL